MTTRLSDLELDFNKIETDHTNLFYEFKDYSSLNNLFQKDIGADFTMEKLKNTLEVGAIYKNIEDLYSRGGGNNA